MTDEYSEQARRVLAPVLTNDPTHPKTVRARPAIFGLIRALDMRGWQRAGIFLEEQRWRGMNRWLRTTSISRVSSKLEPSGLPAKFCAQLAQAVARASLRRELYT